MHGSAVERFRVLSNLQSDGGLHSTAGEFVLTYLTAIGW